MYLPILSAFLGIIAFLPFNFYPFVFIFLVPFFLFLLREEKFWRLIAGTALFQIIFLSGTVYFTMEPILWTEVILIFLGLPVVIWLIKNFSVRLALLPFIFTFFSHAQARFSLIPTYIMTAGNALGSSLFVGLANYGGLIALTFFVAVINMLITAIILRRGSRESVIYLTTAAVLILFFAWNFSGLELRKNSVAYDNLPNSFTVATVSVNDKFTADSFPELILELKNQKTDLIVFPEDIFNQRTDSSVFQNIAKEFVTNVIVAHDTFQDENKYNSAILFDTKGNIVGIHDKNRLTFPGEYWPFGNWRPFFYEWIKERRPEIVNYAVFGSENAYTSGERNLLSMKHKENSIIFAAPICLEIHYPSDLKEYESNGARFIVNQSSNRWISYGLSHYLYLTENLKKIEAVWLGIPIISSGVDDIADIVLPNGQSQTAPISTKNYKIFFGEIKY